MPGELFEAVSELYRELAAGDRAQALERLAADVEWVIAGATALAGAYQGRDEVGALWSRMAHLGWLPRPSQVLVDGSRAVVLGRAGAGGADVADVLDVEDGLVCRFLGIGYVETG